MNWNINDNDRENNYRSLNSGGYDNGYGSWQPSFRELPDPPSRSRKPKQKYLTRGTAALMLVFSMLVSGVLGFAGGMVASQFSQQNQGSSLVEQTPISSSSEGINYSPVAASSGLTVAEIAAKTANSVVEITTEVVSSNYRGRFVSSGAGSGVIVSSDGYIATNNHVIDGASKITVRLKNGDEYSATLVATDSKTDVALIKIEATGLSAATFGDSDKLVVGELAVAIGNPLGELGGTVTDGIISALDREITLDGRTMNLLQTSAAINPGNSGGGLFNSKGELIGIVVAKSTGEDIEGLGFAIPINDAKAVLEELKTHGYVTGRPSMGVMLQEILDSRTAMTYRVRQLGVYVAQVVEGSPAQAAGLQAGDLLVSIDGTIIGSTSDVINYLADRKVGETINIEVMRDSQPLKLPLTLGEDVPKT